MDKIEIMGMTDNQWKDNLRVQLEDWEEVEEFLRFEKTEEALKKIEKIKARISQIPRRKQSLGSLLAGIKAYKIRGYQYK